MSGCLLSINSLMPGSTIPSEFRNYASHIRVETALGILYLSRFSGSTSKGKHSFSLLCQTLKFFEQLSRNKNDYSISQKYGYQELQYFLYSIKNLSFRWWSFFMDSSFMHITIRKVIKGPIASWDAALVRSTSNVNIHFMFR